MPLRNPILLVWAIGLGAAIALDRHCAPGGNFDLAHWSLQLPYGDGGNIRTIKSQDLQGRDGFTGTTFYTDRTTGQMVLTAPGNPNITGCTTTSGSIHCRTELRQVHRSNGRNIWWSPRGINGLKVKMTVVKPDDGTRGTVIGQVFASGPLAEMYYSQRGEIVVGVKAGPGERQTIVGVGHVAVGTQFTYELSYSNNVLFVTINRKRTRLDTSGYDSPPSYFKVGNYNQARSGEDSEVHIAAISVLHKPSHGARG
ncbi:polysaccharide lyase family 7 [Ophiocordyceps sinensis CO18]|uniref:Polysaccharide lyase family 7 n=1 Tax=Ophiocordyceps sinensis (strain Co18 / CGMCC 3.14243) TaxID=911162 RepID=T5ACW8_OPHSC|nr:polysaccharide lyase family 7 [Ophiocordyceps sinensis CO18]